jgi:hypothetical protein
MIKEEEEDEDEEMLWFSAADKFKLGVEDVNCSLIVSRVIYCIWFANLLI